MLAGWSQVLTNPKFPTQDAHASLKKKLESKKIETHHPKKYQLALQNSTAMQHDEHSGEDTNLTSIAITRKAETF